MGGIPKERVFASERKSTLTIMSGETPPTNERI